MLKGNCRDAATRLENTTYRYQKISIYEKGIISFNHYSQRSM